MRGCAGVILPLLSQSVMFWNLTFSKFVLKKQLQWQQLLGAAAVVVGVCIAAFPADGGPGLLAGVRSLTVSSALALHRYSATDAWPLPGLVSEMQPYGRSCSCLARNLCKCLGFIAGSVCCTSTALLLWFNLTAVCACITQRLVKR